MNENPDVVVMDHFLEVEENGMTGLDYLNKKKKSFKEVQVIMISAYSLRKGAVTYIQKGRDAMSGFMQGIQKALLKLQGLKKKEIRGILN